MRSFSRAAAAEEEEEADTTTDYAKLRRKNFFIHGTTKSDEIIVQDRSEIILIIFNLWLEFQKPNFSHHKNSTLKLSTLCKSLYPVPYSGLYVKYL
jgi:hypothetical protein